MESDLDPCRNYPAPIVSLVFKVLAQVPYDTSRFIKSFGVSFPLVQKQRIRTHAPEPLPSLRAFVNGVSTP